jgi:hypothetical protein
LRPAHNKGVVRVKRIMTGLVTAIALLAVPGAAAGSATVERFPVSWVLSSDTCSNLPAGTTVEGTGTMKSISRERTTAGGVTTLSNTSTATGTATDQDGNTYVFLYSNTFRASNSTTDPGVFTGIMNDAFSLAGPGPAKLSNGFTARITITTFFRFDPIRAYGDPISFPEGEARCDPL